MNLHQKLLEIRKQVEYLKKENKGAQYNYVSSSQVLASVREKMNAMGVLLIPAITGTNVRVKEESKAEGKITQTFFTEINMLMTWVDVEEPNDKIEVLWYAQGVDIAGEKGVGKALTYGEKYFILKSFNIPTDKDDPDAFQEKNKTAPPKEPPKAKAKGKTKEEAVKFFDDFIGDEKIDKQFIQYFTNLFNDEARYKLCLECEWEKQKLLHRISSILIGETVK